MAVTELTSSNGAFTFAGAGGVGGGSWATDSTANLYPGSRSAKKTTAATDQVTIVVSGSSCFLVTQAQNSTPGVVSVSVDGVAQNGWWSAYQTAASGNNIGPMLMPLYRGLTDASHTVVIVVTSGTFIVDSVLVVSGAKIAPAAVTRGTPRVMACLGDSVTYGYGASTTSQYWVNRLAALLTADLGYGITIQNKGLPSDALTGRMLVSPAGTLMGLQYRLWNDIISPGIQPEILLIMGGINDLRSGRNAIDAGHSLTNLLALVSDAFDLTQMCCVVATPSYMTNEAAVATNILPTTAQGNPWEQFKLYAEAVQHIAQQFGPNILLANVYEAFGELDELVFPNAQGAADFGIHPNDAGHGVIAMEFHRVIMERLSVL